MKLSTLLDPAIIKCGLDASTKEEVLEEMARLTAGGTPGVTAEDLRAALAERERLGPFSMIRGCALVHARTEKVDDFRVALATSKKGIDFKAPDGEAIRVIVMFVIPRRHSNLYLNALARFLDLFGVPANLDRVAGAADAAGVVAAVEALSGAPADPPPRSVTPSTPLARALKLLQGERLPVVDGTGRLVGEFRAESVVRLVVRERHVKVGGKGDPLQVALNAHADSTLEALGLVSPDGYAIAGPDDTPAEIAVKLAEAKADRAYVVREGRLTGSVTAAEVLRRLGGGS